MSKDEILPFVRSDGRKYDEIRPIKIIRNYLKWAEGSVLIEQGDTKIIVSASIEDHVPSWLKDTGKGWITAEYDMIPRSTDKRHTRERNRGISGRSHEIQRLIGRAVRGVFDCDTLGEITIKIDCDVIQADGGTRCASITGAIVATYDALQKAVEQQIIDKIPEFNWAAAISVGIIRGTPLLDLCYAEDSEAGVDMNIVMNEKEEFIEIQGTAEKEKFNQEQLTQMLQLAKKGIKQIIEYIKSLYKE